MVNSAIGDFECAFGGFVVAEGIGTDELTGCHDHRRELAARSSRRRLHVRQLRHGGLHLHPGGLYSALHGALGGRPGDQQPDRMDGRAGAQPSDVARRGQPVCRVQLCRSWHVDVPGGVRPRSARGPAGDVRARGETLHRRHHRRSGRGPHEHPECGVRGAGACASFPAQHCRGDRRRDTRAVRIRLQRQHGCDQRAAIQPRLQRHLDGRNGNRRGNGACAHDREWSGRFAFRSRPS